MRTRYRMRLPLGMLVCASAACSDGTGPGTSLGTLASISAGSLHTCGLTSHGVAYCWGANVAGQLGSGTLSTFESTARAVAGNFTFSVIDAGGAFTCGLTSDGRAYCWGDNGGGKLGIGSLNGSESAPALPVAGGSLQFSSISVGLYATCALTKEGVAYCWGGVPGIPATGVPVAVGANLRFKQIAAGGSSVCGLTTAGEVYCQSWADSLPVLVPGGLKFISISSGAAHRCGLTADGVAYCWGNNWWGQLGIGTFIDSAAVPTPVAGALHFTALALGNVHSCAVTADGTAYCWGSNSTFALGDHTPGRWSIPRLVAGGHRFLSVTTGSALDYGYSCGVSVDGAGYCWGDNTFGQLGSVSFSQLGADGGGYSPRRVIGF